MTIRVAIIDSGFDAEIVDGAAKFFSFHNDRIQEDTARPDVHSHGSALAATISSLAPRCDLINAQVFAENLACSPLAIAAAIDWSIEQGAKIINMSFGLAEDRDVLRQACVGAIEKGVFVFAAAPARGDPVYPSAYPGVTKVSGDARLQNGEVSILRAGSQADYGGCVAPGGASFAVAQIAGIAANWLDGNKRASQIELNDYLDSIACFDLPERRTGA